MEKNWNNVKSALAERIPNHSFRMWIEPLEMKEWKGSDITLVAPNFFSRKRVLDNYADLIKGEIDRFFGISGNLSVEVAVQKQRKSNSDIRPATQMDLPKIGCQPQCGRLLRKDFTFDQFVVGSNCDFAYTAALSLAAHKNTHQGSLMLLSKTGMGKSHLAQAVGHHILSEYPHENVYYITAEDFTNEMIHAFRYDKLETFKKKYRDNCDVLLIEDIHFLSGKERTQMELTSTLDTLLDAGKKIIFSSCYAPGDIPKISDQLRSRLTSGLISTIEPPKYRTRVRILQQKSKQNGIQMPSDVTDYLAEELAEDVRQLESGLIGVAARASLLGTPINLDLARSAIKDIVHKRKTITIDLIKKIVCKEFNITVKEIVSRSRKQNIVRPRQIAIYLSRRYTDSPLQSIGKSFNRYHATALHAINAVERGMKTSTAVQKQVEFLCDKLESGNF